MGNPIPTKINEEFCGVARMGMGKASPSPPGSMDISRYLVVAIEELFGMF